MHHEGAVFAEAAQHHGVFTKTEWTAAGLSDSTLSRRLRSGHVVRLHHGVYAHAASPNTHAQRVTAAAKACTDLGAASHVTAAFLWGMVSFGGRNPRDIEVVTRRWRRVESGVTVHESMDLVEEDVTVLDGVPITMPARTLVDLGASAKGLVGPALDQAIRHELTTVDEVLVLLQRVARRGRDGVGIIRPHLGEHLLASQFTESYLETLFFRGLSRFGIPRPEPQFRLRRADGSVVCRLDFAYPDVRLGIALDGMEFHTSRHRFQLDRAQQNEAELQGWMILRYTWWDISGGMARTADQVRKARAARTTRNGVPRRRP
jgi:hypothetical protein